MSDNISNRDSSSSKSDFGSIGKNYDSLRHRRANLQTRKSEDPSKYYINRKARERSKSCCKDKEQTSVKRNKSAMCINEKCPHSPVSVVKSRRYFTDELVMQEEMKNQEIVQNKKMSEDEKKDQKIKQQLRRTTFPCKEDNVKDVSERGNETLKKDEVHELLRTLQGVMEQFKTMRMHQQNETLRKEDVHEIVRHELQSAMKDLKTMPIQQEPKKTGKNEIQERRNSNTLRSDVPSCVSNSSYTITYDVGIPNPEETIEHLKEEIIKNEEHIEYFKGLWEDECEDKKRLKSVVDQCERVTMKIEDNYISQKDKHKTLTEKLELIEKKSETKKKFNIRQTVANLFGQKDTNKPRSKSLETLYGKIQRRLSLLERNEIVWIMCQIEVSNNKMSFYQVNENDARCANACKTISISDIWGVHSVQLSDFKNAGLQNIKDYPLVFLVLVSEKDNQYGYRKTATAYQPSSNTIKEVYFRADSIDEKNTWIQQLNQLIEGTKQESPTLRQDNISYDLSSSNANLSQSFSSSRLPSCQNVSYNFSPTYTDSAPHLRSSMFSSQGNLSFKLPPTYRNSPSYFRPPMSTSNDVQGPTQPSNNL